MMIHHPLVLLLTRFIHTVLRSSLRMWAWQSVVLFKGSYKFARISWQFSLCVSRLTKCLTSSATHLVMGFIARDQSTNNQQTNKQTLSSLGVGGGEQRPQLHDASDSCRFVNNDKTMTSFWCCTSATTPTFAKRFTLL
jgi:hypothetical protein